VAFQHRHQPILNQNCVQCHGGVRQKNGVSFIYREEALGVGKSADEPLCRAIPAPRS
jgi:mono/diheme cytochrome c family protein